jgi:hypothetical protein
VALALSRLSFGVVSNLASRLPPIKGVFEYPFLSPPHCSSHGALMLPGKPDTLKRIVAFCAGRYNALQGTPRHNLALAYSAILAQARDLALSSADPERDLLDYLSKPHADADLTKACKEVLEHIGTPP